MQTNTTKMAEVERQNLPNKYQDFLIEHNTDVHVIQEFWNQAETEGQFIELLKDYVDTYYEGLDVDPKHYNDGCSIDYRVVDEFGDEPFGVMVNSKGDAETVFPTQAYPLGKDLMETCERLAVKDGLEGDELAKCLHDFKEYLKACGASDEDFGE